ncbi:serine/threonine-protein kinase [Thermopirellula anaerolimosa]
MLETQFAVEHRSPNPPGSSPPPDASPAGRRFFYAGGARPLEGYTIKRGIGHGGFGEVYYAVADSGKDVALKLIRRNLEVELRGIAHCLNLKHPNLLAIYNVLQDADENYWVVMEYVAGKSLQEVLAEHPQGLPVSEALAWFHGLAAGVGHLHKHGIVHRDLKPGNIFCEEGVVKVGDYGLSKFIACSRRSGQTESVGTVHYMAPEIANGRYGKEIDIYALGVMLYEMLTGRLPFEGETVGEILMKHLTASPDLSGVPAEFREVVARALEKDPDKRFHDIAEMLALLPAPPPGGYCGPTVGAAAVEKEPDRPRHDQAREAETAYVQAELADPPDEEPIYRGLKRGVRRVREVWESREMTTPVKVLVLAGLVVLVFFNAGFIFPAVMGLLMLYACYWVVRALVVKPRSGAARTPQAGRPFAPGSAGLGAGERETIVHRYYSAGTRRRMLRAELSRRPMRQRVTELLGSLLASSAVAAIAVLMLALLRSFQQEVPSLPQGAWVYFMTVAASWSILIAGKFWESGEGDTALRRFIMLVVGLLLGLLGFALMKFFLADLPFDPRGFRMMSGNFRLPWSVPSGFYDGGEPMLPAMIAVFGTLFLILRWWRLCDPMRSQRLTVGSIIVAALASALVATAWEFPLHWLMMPAVATSLTVQMSAPWFTPLLKSESQPRWDE